MCIGEVVVEGLHLSFSFLPSSLPSVLTSLTQEVCIDFFPPVLHHICSLRKRGIYLLKEREFSLFTQMATQGRLV